MMEITLNYSAQGPTGRYVQVSINGRGIGELLLYEEQVLAFHAIIAEGCDRLGHIPFVSFQTSSWVCHKHLVAIVNGPNNIRGFRDYPVAHLMIPRNVDLSRAKLWYEYWLREPARATDPECRQIVFSDWLLLYADASRAAATQVITFDDTDDR